MLSGSFPPLPYLKQCSFSIHCETIRKTCEKLYTLKSKRKGAVQQTFNHLINVIETLETLEICVKYVQSQR